jgi:phasin family protein
MFDFSQTLAKRQVDLLKESFSKTESLLKGFDAKKQPQAYVEEAKAALEKAMADVKETMDLGMKAQHEVVDLFVKRATANFDEVKSLAA